MCRTVQVKSNHVVVRVQELFEGLETGISEAVVLEIDVPQHIVHVALQCRDHCVTQFDSAQVQCFERVVLAQRTKYRLGHVITERVI